MREHLLQEDNIPNYPINVLKIPNATPDTKDAAQYMLRKGIKQYNLCGEFSVAFCMKDQAHTDNIDDFLDYWEAKDLKWYQKWFSGGISRTTGIVDLERMLSDYGIMTPCQKFSPVPPSLKFIQSKLDIYKAIIGVQIDFQGYLVGKGIPHWVVLDLLDVADNLRAVASIYNPFTNNIEPYSWKEVMTSTGAYKQGIWVQRV